MNWIAWIIVAVVVVLYLKDKSKTPQKPQEIPQAEPELPKSQSEYSGHYQAKYILTRNEWYEYKKLREYAAAHSLQICPKVRLLDIVEPRKGDPNYMSYMGKIKSKHVDFVICDQDLRIKGIIELDDSSHDIKDRQERDAFVDAVLQDVGYIVIHTRSVTETTLEPITGPKEPLKKEDNN